MRRIEVITKIINFINENDDKKFKIYDKTMIIHILNGEILILYKYDFMSRVDLLMTSDEALEELSNQLDKAILV